jgi:hypothetical protein
MPAMTLRSPLVRFGHVPATTPRSHGRKRVHGLPGGGGDGATGRRVSHNQSHSRAALTPTFNRYKSSFFERAQRPAFRIRLDTPFLQHQVGNEEAVVTPQPFKVPEGQSD